MKILKTEQYISEKLNIKPVSKDRLAKWGKEPDVNAAVKGFIRDFELVWNHETKRYDCSKHRVIMVDDRIVSDGMLIINFGKINGDFKCNKCNLKSLKGSPTYVRGNFVCQENNLKSLEGAPQEVDNIFSCGGNELETLKGAPQTVGNEFDCCSNKLKSLEGAPQEVGGDFLCDSNKLTSLNGAPQYVGGDFHCSDNPNLVLPKDKPSWLEGEFKE